MDDMQEKNRDLDAEIRRLARKYGGYDKIYYRVSEIMQDVRENLQTTIYNSKKFKEDLEKEEKRVIEKRKECLHNCKLLQEELSEIDTRIFFVNANKSCDVLNTKISLLNDLTKRREFLEKEILILKKELKKDPEEEARENAEFAWSIADKDWIGDLCVQGSVLLEILSISNAKIEEDVFVERNTWFYTCKYTWYLSDGNPLSLMYYYREEKDINIRNDMVMAPYEPEPSDEEEDEYPEYMNMNP